MASAQLFRFLDLPKELRLMVYKCLPTKMTHYEINSEGLPTGGLHFEVRNASYLIEDGPRTQFHGHDWPVFPVKIVHKTMSGLAILATCQEIASEAGAIIHPKLRAMSEGPAQIIMDNVGLGNNEIAIMMHRFSFASSGKNIKRLLHLDEDVLKDADLFLPGTTSRPVHITLRNSVLYRSTADIQRCIVRMRVLREEMLTWFRSELSECFTYFAGLDTEDSAGPRVDMHLHFRMATLTANETEAYDRVLPLVVTGVPEHEGAPTFTIDSGEVLDADE
jgi:hypothetical protein